MPVTLKSPPVLPQKVIPEFFVSSELSFICSALQLRMPKLIRLIRSIQSTEMIASINKKTINTIDLIHWHLRPHQPSCTTVVSFFDFPGWLRQGLLLWYIQCHLVDTVNFASYFASFSTQYCSGIHIRGETVLPKRNGLLLYISQSAVYSWISPTNRTLFLCSRNYQLQHGGYDNHFKSHSIW